MRKRLLSALGVLVLTTSSVNAQTLNIDHQPVGCAVADRFPQLEARFAPGDAVATARVLFQPENAQHWYAVAMKSEGPAFSGVLPKPKKSLKAFRYYIEVTDKALGTNRTAEYTTNVVASPGECKGKIMAAALGSASVLLQVPAGAAALPVGFASTGVVAAGSGSAAAAAGASAGGGGGLSTGAVVGIVAGAGAAAAGVAAAVGKGGGASSVTYRVTFESNSNQSGIGLVECGGSPGLFFSWQFVTPNASGNFDTVWGDPTPVLRAVGQVTPTTFQATLTCTNGARSGSISATGSTSGYVGTFEFGNSRGPVTVTRE